MANRMTNSVDVAQLVIRAPFDNGLRYLLARRTEDGYWEFIGGKREEGESLREAAKRELDEELKSISPRNAVIEKVGDSYPSSFGEEYMLHPILIEFTESMASNLDEDDLCHEHDAMAWISLSEYEEYETLGQYPALESLNLAGEA